MIDATIMVFMFKAYIVPKGEYVQCFSYLMLTNLKANMKKDNIRFFFFLNDKYKILDLTIG